MDDRRCPGVKKVKAFQDLSAPASQDFRFHYLETLQVAERKGKRFVTENKLQLFINTADKIK